MPTDPETARHYCLWRRCTSRGPYEDGKTLFEHIEEAHNVQPRKGEQFYCKWEDCKCLRAISGKKHRTDHLITHARYKPLVCTETGCGATFSTAHSMNAHLSIRHAAAGKSPSKSPSSKRKRTSVSGGRVRPAQKRRLADGNEAASESDGDTATSTRAATYATSSDGAVAEENNLQLRRRVQAAEENMKRMQMQLDVLLHERASSPLDVQQTPERSARRNAAAIQGRDVQAREAWEVDASDARSGCVIA